MLTAPHPHPTPKNKNTPTNHPKQPQQYGEPVLQKAEGTPIDWKAGKNVTVKVMKKKPRRGAPANAKPQTKTEPVPSFFRFFSPPEIPQTAEAVAELDEEAVEELREEVEADFELGMILRDELVPDAYRWWSGEAAEEEDEEEDEDDDDEDDDDEGDDDEDDDSEEDEEDESDDEGGGGKKGKKGGGKKGGKGGAAGGVPLGPDGKPQDCKQQ
jgi:nucleosome assembly protein 1-like 1